MGRAWARGWRWAEAGGATCGSTTPRSPTGPRPSDPPSSTSARSPVPLQPVHPLPPSTTAAIAEEKIGMMGITCPDHFTCILACNGFSLVVVPLYHNYHLVREGRVARR